MYCICAYISFYGVTLTYLTCRVEEMFVDSTAFFDGELKALKKISSASVSRIAELSQQQEENEER